MNATHTTSNMDENRATWKNLKGNVEDALDYLLTARVYTEMVDLDDKETVEDARAQQAEAEEHLDAQRKALDEFNAEMDALNLHPVSDPRSPVYGYPMLRRSNGTWVTPRPA